MIFHIQLHFPSQSLCAFISNSSFLVQTTPLPPPLPRTNSLRTPPFHHNNLIMGTFYMVKIKVIKKPLESFLPSEMQKIGNNLLRLDEHLRMNISQEINPFSILSRSSWLYEQPGKKIWFFTH